MKSEEYKVKSEESRVKSEELYAMALTRLSGVNHAVALQLYKELGDAQAVYEATKGGDGFRGAQWYQGADDGGWGLSPTAP